MHGVDGRLFAWEMQMRMKRLRPTLAKQTLLCKQDTTLDDVKKELSLEIHGKMYTNLLFTNLEWKFNPEHRVNDLFDGDFKLISRFGFPVCVQQERPLDQNIPICLDLELSGQQWKVDEHAMEEMRLEETPGIQTMLQKFEEEVDHKIKKILDGLDEAENSSNSNMISLNNGLERCLVRLGDPMARLPQDGSLCDETARLGIDAEVNVPMDTNDDTGRKGSKTGKRK